MAAGAKPVWHGLALMLTSFFNMCALTRNLAFPVCVQAFPTRTTLVPCLDGTERVAIAERILRENQTSHLPPLVAVWV
jgi:hypothetical protein